MRNDGIKYSAVVATYNRSSLLKKCLAALASQTVPRSDYEIIIVNDGSTDDTLKVLEEFSKENPGLNFRYFTQENGGPSKARNLGIKHSKGEIIFFTDDDCVVPDNWIETLADCYKKHPEIAGAGGWYEFNIKENASKFSLAYIDHENMIFRFAYPDSLTVRPKDGIIIENFTKTPAGNTSNMSYKKNILERAGAFDEKIDFVGWVDWELKKRIMDSGEKLLFINFFVSHEKPLSFPNIIFKFFNRGRGMRYFAMKNPSMYNFYYPFLGPITFCKFMNQVFLSANISEYQYRSSTATIFFISAIRKSLAAAGWHYQHFKIKLDRSKYD